MKPSQKDSYFVLYCVVILCASFIVALGIKEGRKKMAQAKKSLISAVQSTPVEQEDAVFQVIQDEPRVGQRYADNMDNADGEQFTMPGGDGFGNDMFGNTGSNMRGTGRGFGRGNITNSSIGATASDNPSGAYLESIDASGRASRFNLLQGDIVISIDGQPVTGAESFDTLINGVVQGAAVNIRVLRNGEEITVGREAVSFGVRGVRGGG